MSSLECFAQVAPNMIVGVWDRDKEMCKSPNADHHMRVGSITKMFTAIAIKQLVSQGKISLEDPVIKYLNFDLSPQITIEHLATMKSGLFDYSNDATYIASCMVNSGMKWNPEQLVSIALKNDVLFEPGEKWMSCNVNYILLGLILEKVTGESLEKVLKICVFQPFQMNSTFLPTTAELPHPYFEGFQYIKDKLINVTNCNPSMAWASGGVVSTLNDLYKFAKILIKGHLLSFERCKNSPNNYGFGIMNLDGYFGHSGNFPGYQSFLAVNPETNRIVIVLTNLKLTLDGKSPADLVGYEIIEKLRNYDVV
jgi:D-alanyl-D-alanine carboxypeptidase